MIREQMLSGLTWEVEGPLGLPVGPVEPTAGVLVLVVHDGEAKLLWEEQGLTGNRDCAFMLPARSLLLALQAACEDSRPDDPEVAWKYSQEMRDQLRNAWDDDEVKQMRDQRRAEKSWTRELDRTLVGLWLEGDGEGLERIKGPGDVFDDRDPIQVRARLMRLGCDPDRPGHMQAGVEVDYEIPTIPELAPEAVDELIGGLGSERDNAGNGKSPDAGEDAERGEDPDDVRS